MTGRLAGKVAAITGGNQGIGLGIAQRFIADGASVSICYLSDQAGTQKVVDDLKSHGGNAIAIQCDVSKIPDGERFIAETEKQLGRVDILVNNAGVERRADFWDITEKDFDFVLNVNLKGLFFITQAFVKHHIAAKTGGKIINISGGGATGYHHKFHRAGRHRNAHKQESPK